MQCSNHQVFDQTLQLLLGLTDGFLLPYDGDQFLLGVVRRREDDACPRLVPHSANVGPATADQEFMVLWFGLKLSGEVVDLLKRETHVSVYSFLFVSVHINPSVSTHLLLGQLQQLFLGLLHLTGRPSDGHLVRAGAFRGEVDVDAAAVLHDGAHQAAFGADQRVVQLGRDGDLRLLDVGLKG